MSPSLAGYRHLTLVHGNNINGTLRSCPRPSTFLCVAVFAAISFVIYPKFVRALLQTTHPTFGLTGPCRSVPVHHPFFVQRPFYFRIPYRYFASWQVLQSPRRFLVPSGGQMMTRSRNSTHTKRFHNATQNEEDVLLKRPRDRTIDRVQSRVTDYAGSLSLLAAGKKNSTKSKTHPNISFLRTRRRIYFPRNMFCLFICFGRGPAGAPLEPQYRDQRRESFFRFAGAFFVQSCLFSLTLSRFMVAD
jgi:hypothetical protein